MCALITSAVFAGCEHPSQLPLLTRVSIQGYPRQGVIAAIAVTPTREVTVIDLFKEGVCIAERVKREDGVEVSTSRNVPAPFDSTQRRILWLYMKDGTWIALESGDHAAESVVWSVPAGADGFDRKLGLGLCEVVDATEHLGSIAVLLRRRTRSKYGLLDSVVTIAADGSIAELYQEASLLDNRIRVPSSIASHGSEGFLVLDRGNNTIGLVSSQGVRLFYSGLPPAELFDPLRLCVMPGNGCVAVLTWGGGVRCVFLDAGGRLMKEVDYFCGGIPDWRRAVRNIMVTSSGELVSSNGYDYWLFTKSGEIELGDVYTGVQMVGSAAIDSFGRILVHYPGREALGVYDGDGRPLWEVDAEPWLGGINSARRYAAVADGELVLSERDAVYGGYGALSSDGKSLSIALDADVVAFDKNGALWMGRRGEVWKAVSLDDPQSRTSEVHPRDGSLFGEILSLAVCDGLVAVLDRANAHKETRISCFDEHGQAKGSWQMGRDTQLLALSSDWVAASDLHGNVELISLHGRRRIRHKLSPTSGLPIQMAIPYGSDQLWMLDIGNGAIYKFGLP